jgi:hypothetical protein
VKKKFIAVIAIILIMAMESTTVFATGAPSPTAGTVNPGSTGSSDDSGDTGSTTITTDGQYLYGDVLMLNGEGTALKLYRLISKNSQRTESNNVQIGMIKVGDANLTELSDIGYEASRQKLLEIADSEEAIGYDIDGIAFNVDSDEAGLTITFLDSRVVATDKANNLVKVFHQLSDGTWEEPEFESFDGGVTVYFQNKLSPVMIVKYSRSADYSDKPSATISGNTSPKTADADNYATIAITIIAIAVILICSKKITDKK